jgi:putative transposase
MRQEGIRTKTVKKWRAPTQSHHRLSLAANTLNRQFTVTHPNRVWAGDLTYVWTTEGWLYLAVVIDLYSRFVIGWAMGSRLTVELAEQALTMALVNRTPRAGLLHHSDRGSQYAAHELPASARRARHHYEHEPERQLLGQRRCRKFLRDPQARTRLPSVLRDP